MVPQIHDFGRKKFKRELFSNKALVEKEKIF